VSAGRDHDWPPPVRDLLRICAVAGVDEAGVRETGGAGRGPADWGSQLELAKRHGTVPLLKQYLDAPARRESVPPAVASSLSALCRGNAIRTLRLGTELCRIHARFEEHGISVVPYKGPTFGEYAYGDACLRPFFDLDLLIHEKDLDRAATLLLADGYKAEFEFDAKRAAALLRQDCERSFYHARRDTLVELHWGIVPRYASFGLSGEEVLAHVVPFEFFGRRMMIPTPEYMLLILAVHHGGKHQWASLGSIVDVARLIRSSPGLDWDGLTRLAARKRMSRALRLGLFLAQDLLGVELPAAVGAWIRQDHPVTKMAADVYQRLFADGEGPRGKLDHLAFSLNLRDGVADRVSYCLAQLATSDLTDRQRLKLPRPLEPLAGVMRFGRWLAS
jgi:hypothetical protein